MNSTAPNSWAELVKSLGLPVVLLLGLGWLGYQWFAMQIEHTRIEFDRRLHVVGYRAAGTAVLDTTGASPAIRFDVELSERLAPRTQ